MVGTDQRTDRRVELVSWPAEAERRAELAARDVPRLLLVAEGVAPPRVERDEDWIRMPADERDVWTRLRRLSVLHERRRSRPRLHPGAVLVLGCRDDRVPVSAADAALLRPLADRFGELVLWDELAAALAPAGPVSARALRSRVARLRSRVQPLALAIHTVRGRGVLLTGTTGDGAG
jgi:hypothetical protein